MIIPFFIVYQGCPNRCIFCNVRKIAGNHTDRVTKKTFQEKVNKYLGQTKLKRERVQIAFYGGNFTGMEKERQSELLEYAHPFIKKGLVHEIRISTRPDNINRDCLVLLEQSGVTTVEIGAQSLVDEVLTIANRGHSSCDVINAVNILKEQGFKTGIHLMAGLPGDSRSGFEYTIDKTLALKPDMVRLHPTIVFEDTGLADLYGRGAYSPLGIPEAIELCKYALKRFDDANIPVIRLGLQMTREMEDAGSIIAGPYHPAFRSLVEESMFFDSASSMLCAEHVVNKVVTFFLSPKDVSSFRGQKNRNLQELKTRFGLADIRVSADPNLPRRSLSLITDGTGLEADISDKAEQGASIV